MNKLLSLSFTALSCSVSLVFASFTPTGEEISVRLKSNDGALAPSYLYFKLPRIELSKSLKLYLRQQLSQYPKNSTIASSSKSLASELPKRVDLGMEGTPVLNQGNHGTCVTFAVSAAINAALGAGNYVSQLCSLELGSYLAINDQMPASGWNGSMGAWVFEQMFQYGIVPSNYQTLHGCAGVKKYPILEEDDEGEPMSITDYVAHSIPIAKLLSWEPLLKNNESLLAKREVDDTINVMKTELAKGNRLTIGMLLDIKVNEVGAAGTNKITNDTWMLTPQIIRDAMDEQIDAGHELVVIGYDDNKVITDSEGTTNKGVFILRNSWSKEVGDKGNYYVTYDYVKFLALEVAAIRKKVNKT